jgi:polysaccharide deacetylase 2 family uncharacterized protein YibQ
MAADDLTRPLGLPSPAAAGARQRRRIVLGTAAIAAVAVVGAAAWFLVPAGPTATAVIAAGSQRPPPIPTVAPGAVAPDRTGSTSAALAPAHAGLTEVEPAAGGLSEVGKVVIHDPSNPDTIQLASLPDQKLIEASKDGPLPRIAEDGTRPLDAYARPAGDPHGARIAIVIGGLGIDPAGTSQAIASLPGAVTLAFAPYGDGLARDVADARAAGHEILLQVPLEPFNYPQTDPGINTLTVKATPAENLSRLHWVLGRLTNYVGVVNYMGARFTAQPGALAPVMAEIGKRGLLYLDDGSSTRSAAADAAGANTPFLRADLVLDGELTAAAIDQQLTQLQAIARERGYAVATATAFPMTVERVGAFARAAAAKGIAIVPVSSLLPART